jgi:hypothetical protein
MAWGLAAALATSFASVAAFASEEVAFAPHRAVYDITLANSSAGSGVAGLNGRMVYELNGSPCEGYTQNMRFVTVMTNEEGAETVNDLRNSSWEDAVGKKLRFSSSQYQNDVLAEASQGDASRVNVGVPAGVELAKPSKKRLQLPADIYFPMQHATSLIQAAKSGKQLFTAHIYDGTEKGDKYYLTSAVIGKKYERGAKPFNAALKEPGQLLAAESWPMSISYFELGQDKQDSMPTYELSFRYFENGVTSDLKIDYGEFSIRGDLKEISFLPPSKCNGEAAKP